MKPPPSPNLAGAPEDRLRLLRQSYHCYVLGWLALLPALGFSLGPLALVLHRRVLRETGEMTPPNRHLLVWGVGLPVMTAYAAWFDVTSGCLVLALTMALQAGLLWRSYRQGAPPRPNPLRRAVYQGALLAWLGISLSLALALALGCWLRFLAQ